MRGILSILGHILNMLQGTGYSKYFVAYFEYFTVRNIQSILEQILNILQSLGYSKYFGANFEYFAKPRV